MPTNLNTDSNSHFIQDTFPTVISKDEQGNLRSIDIEINWDLLANDLNNGKRTVLKDVITFRDAEEREKALSFSKILNKIAPLYIKTICKVDEPGKEYSPIIGFSPNLNTDYLTPDENSDLTIPTPFAKSKIDDRTLPVECLAGNCENPDTDLLIYRASEDINGETYISELSIPIFRKPLSDYSPPIFNYSGNDIIITSNDITLLNGTISPNETFTLPDITAKNFMGEDITDTLTLTVAVNNNQPDVLYLIYKATDTTYNVSSEKVITVYKQNSADNGPLITMKPEITHLVPHSSGELVLPKVTSIDYKGNNIEVTKQFVQDTTNLNIWTLTYSSIDDLGNSSSKEIKINAVFPNKLKDIPPLISLQNGSDWPDALTYTRNSDINLPQVKAEDRNGNSLSITCNCNPPEDIENSPNYWVVDYTATDAYGFKTVRSIKIGTNIAPLLVLLGDLEIEVDVSENKYQEEGTLLIDKYDVNKIVNAKDVDGNNTNLEKITNKIIGNYQLIYVTTNSLGVTSHNTLTRTIKLYDGKKDFILLDFTNNYNDTVNGYNYSDVLTQKKNVCEINCSEQKDIIERVNFSRQIIVHSSEYSVSTSSNKVLRLFTSQDKNTIQFTIDILEDIIGTIDTISFDTNNINIKYNLDGPSKSEDFNDNITRLYFNIDENTNDTESFSFTVTKDSADNTVTGFDVLINNIVIKFKDTPVYNILDKNYTDNTRQTVESNKEFIERVLSDKNIVSNNALLNKFIDTVNNFATINNLTKDNLDIVGMSEYTTDNISVLNKTLKTVTNDSFISIPDENGDRNIVWNGNNQSLPDEYDDIIVVDNKRIILNKELGNGINLYDVVDSFILGKSYSGDESAKFTEMITKHVNKNNKNNFYEHVKKFSKNKFTIAPETINNIVTLGDNQIFSHVLKNDYPFQSREYLYMSPSEQIITITSDEFKKIKTRDMIIYLGLNDNDQVKFEIENSIVEIKQQHEGSYKINSGESVLFDDQTFNVDKYRFEMVFSGSLGIQLAGVFKSGIGGDPYIQPLLGPRYKIPYGENSYKYLDNGKEDDQFFINFSTFTLQGNELSNLNSFVLSTIMKRQNLNNIKETAKMLYSKGLALDTNACFMDKIYIRNGNQEMYFDLEKFRVVDIDNNNTGLPYGFRPVKISNININESIGQHIVINNEKPIATLRIETYHKSYGMIYIDFLKFSHPQIRSAINIQTEIPLNANNCSGAIISENNILLESINSNKTCKNLNKQSKIIEEVYVDSNGNYLVNEILE